MSNKAGPGICCIEGCPFSLLWKPVFLPALVCCACYSQDRDRNRPQHVLEGNTATGARRQTMLQEVAEEGGGRFGKYCCSVIRVSSSTINTSIDSCCLLVISRPAACARGQPFLSYWQVWQPAISGVAEVVEGSAALLLAANGTMALTSMLGGSPGDRLLYLVQSSALKHKKSRSQSLILSSEATIKHQNLGSYTSVPLRRVHIYSCGHIVRTPFWKSWWKSDFTS